MTISPDTKDWTWVTTQSCDQCGFDPDQLPLNQIAPQIMAQVQEWPEALARPNVTRRPEETTWSVLEYGAHVRDVLIVMRGRLGRMLTEDNPDLPSWDQDQAAIDGKYQTLNPALVADEIGIEAQMLSSQYAQVHPEQAERLGQRSDGSEFTVLSLGKYLVHDLRHHAWDVQK